MRRAFILIAAALMLSACCGRNCPAEVAVIPQPQVVETGRSTVVLRAGEYDVVRSLDSTMRASSYSLDIDKKGVRICAGDEAGLFYAEQTLRQLVPADSAEVTLNRTHIEDWPEFGYRGMMLDVARHFFSVEDVKTVLDIMALHKLNYLHWHLVPTTILAQQHYNTFVQRMKDFPVKVELMSRFRSAGAYGEVMASTYNCRTLPAAVFSEE